MKMKKIIAAVSTLAITAGMFTAVPMTAQAALERPLVYGTDYTLAGVFTDTKAECTDSTLYTDTSAIFKDTTTVGDYMKGMFNDTGATFYRAKTVPSQCCSYAVFDMKNSAVSSASWDGGSKLFFYETDDTDNLVLNKVPSDFGNSEKDIAGSNCNTFQNSFQLTWRATSKTSTATFNPSTGKKYLVVFFGGDSPWSTTYIKNFELNTSVPTAATVTIGSETKEYATFAEAVSAANGKTATITVYEDVTVEDGSTFINEGADSNITINAAEGKTVTLTRKGTPPTSNAMFRTDRNKYNGYGTGGRTLSFGTEGGTLIIKDEAQNIPQDTGTFMIGGYNVSSVNITLGSHCTVSSTGGDYVFFSWGKSANHLITIDGADLTALSDKDLVSTHNNCEGAYANVKGNAKFSTLKFDTAKTILDITGYTGTPIAINPANTELGTVIAKGRVSQLSWTNGTYVLAQDGENVVVAEPAPEENKVAATEVKGENNTDLENSERAWFAEVNPNNQSINLTGAKWVITNTSDASAKVDVTAAVATISGESAYSFGLIVPTVSLGENEVKSVQFTY